MVVSTMMTPPSCQLAGRTPSARMQKALPSVEMETKSERRYGP